MEQLHFNPQTGPKYISGHFVQLTPKNPFLQAECIHVSIESNDYELANFYQFKYIDCFKKTSSTCTCTVPNRLIPEKSSTTLRSTYKIL